MIDLVVQAYAPLPATSLGGLVSRLRIGVPQWAGERAAALQRAKARLGQARVDRVDWYWPPRERPARSALPEAAGVRLLAPFDPLVGDRQRFELFWGWPYRFEAYTPAAKRTRGHYALPLLWGRAGDRVGQCGGGQAPRSAAFRAALADELGRIEAFLGLR